MSFFIKICILPIISLFFLKTMLSNNPDMTPFMNDITTGLYVTFTNETKERPSSVKDIMNVTRRYLVANMDNLKHHGNIAEKSKACYFTSVTYRAAMWDLRRYFEMRSLYTDSMEYEIGFLCHEIIYRYQLLLELYQMVERRFVSFEHKNYASVTYMFYIYTNILEQSKVIIHLCNMLHEVEKKYKNVKKGLFSDYADRIGPDGAPNAWEKNRTSLEQARQAYERWLRQKRREQRKREKERKKYLQQMVKFGLTTARKQTTKKRSWPIQYGWSIENW
ncbi:uncharacterized protein LOC126780086 isoform X2 [Nymphalis io]|uniref:uncharacterized protein LOC126780086 isoform X2 n=1 Tax=Inachis io TaxID=171585 RepID=UPI002168A798|nr:uncharacterized protein LOC126780086 isoform X2 [Nymphalis io]